MAASLELASVLQQLTEACAACRRCGLAVERQQVVVSRGNPAARLMLIGEGPGAQEDSTGLPFVGRSGQLLDQLLAAAGIDSNRDAYVANVVKCRPPGNRKPTAAEMAASYLLRFNSQAEGSPRALTAADFQEVRRSLLAH